MLEASQNTFCVPQDLTVDKERSLRLGIEARPGFYAWESTTVILLNGREVRMSTRLNKQNRNAVDRSEEYSC